jgi:L-threonylcarbamoyladenylate synthase
MMDLSASDGARLIASGQLVAFPTETVYGLGADASSDSAVAKIFATKGRPADHPLIVHVLDAQAAWHFAAEIPDFAQRLIAAFWPGPLTIIVPRKSGVATASAGGQNSIGLRCPSHPLARQLLAECAKLGVHGVSAPSANKFGKISPTTAAHVRAEFGDESAGGVPVLDGGACDVGIESTIIDCTRGAPVLLRPGVLTPTQLCQAMGCDLYHQTLSNHEQTLDILCRLEGQNTSKTSPHHAFAQPTLTPAPRASGSLASHYAPQAPLRLMDAKALQTALDLLGSEGKNIAIYARAVLKPQSDKIMIRRMPQDALATAQQLFAVLRDFDAAQVKLIWVETVPDEPEWDGVRDRLARAAA